MALRRAFPEPLVRDPAIVRSCVRRTGENEALSKIFLCFVCSSLDTHHKREAEHHAKDGQRIWMVPDLPQVTRALVSGGEP